tara:strand:- start:708 stop:1352 length:645 start_codon:yes stop_codon:yes gene_type:complete
MKNRREFLHKCGVASLLGITFSATNEAEAGFFNKKRCPYCAVTDMDISSAALGKQKWDREHFRYFIAARDTYDMEPEVWDNEFRLAFDSWSEVAPLTFEQVDQKDEYDIIISVGSRKREGFGRGGGVLAWAQLPPTRKFDGILLSKFDLAENWILPNQEEHGIILRTVAAHEIGHLLGLHHSNDREALMYPYVNDALKPRLDDINKIQRLYGKP